MRMERRGFLKLLGGAGAALFSGSAIGPEPAPKELPLGKKKLNQEIDNLPPSTIRKLLTQRIKPYYQLEYPKTVDFAGLEIRIKESEVKLRTQNINQVSGRFTFRGSVPSEPLYPAQAVVVKVPYVGLILESEKGEIPPQNLASDGTPLLEITFPPNIPFYTGFSPLMEVTTPDPSAIKPGYENLYEVFERFVFVKEACSHLVFDLWVEEVAKKMRQLNLQSSVEARRRDGSTINAEIISQSINQMHEFNGRIAAAIDLASYMVALKAVEGTELADTRYMDENFKRAYATMRGVSLGETPRDVLYNSLRWALTNPEAKLLYHVGDLTRIP